MSNAMVSPAGRSGMQPEDQSKCEFWKYSQRGHDEITLAYFSAKYFIYMVWGFNIVMFASGIVGSSEVKSHQQQGISRSRPVCALLLPWLALAHSEYHSSE